MFIKNIEKYLIICKNITFIYFLNKIEQKNHKYYITVNDRDINTAVNIINEGKRIIGLSSPEFKRVGEQAVVSSMNLEKNVR